MTSVQQTILHTAGFIIASPLVVLVITMMVVWNVMAIAWNAVRTQTSR